MPWDRLIGLRPGGQQDFSTYYVQASLEAGSGGADSFNVTVRDGRANSVVRFQVPGDSAHLHAWGAAISDALVSHLRRQSLTEFRQFSRCNRGGGSRQPDVWKAYWDGKSAFQRSRWDTAAQYFEEAWRRDNTFAIALWYRNLSRQFGRDARDSELEDLAGRKDQLCAPLDTLVRVQVQPDLEKRMEGYEGLARQYSSYPPVRLLLANELFHRGPLIGRALQEGVDTFWNSAVQLADFDQATTYMQVVWGALRTGNERLAREALSRRAAVTHDKYSQFLRLATEGRFRQWLARPLLAVTFWFADSGFVTDAGEMARVGLFVDAPQEQLAIGRLLASSKHGPTDHRRASGFAAEATALLLLGRPIEALRQLDSGAAFARSDPGYRLQPWEWRVLLPIAGVKIATGEVEAGRRELEAVPQASVVWPRAMWALILDANGRHDVAARDRLMAVLGARARGDSVSNHVAEFGKAIALGDDGNIDSALVLSRDIHREPSDSMQAWRGPFLRALVYLKRGEWQQARKNWPGANVEWLWHENNDFRGWPVGEPQEGELDAALSAVVRVRRAMNFIDLDALPKACPLFKRVGELWRGAEPSFDSLRRVVQKGVDRCHT
jgi:hypothetical protein